MSEDTNHPDIEWIKWANKVSDLQVALERQELSVRDINGNRHVITPVVTFQVKGESKSMFRSAYHAVHKAFTGYQAHHSFHNITRKKV